MRDRQDPPPRNYFFIPLSPRGAAGRMVPHSSYDPNRLSGYLEVAFDVRSPIHVGTGTYTHVDGTITKACVRSRGCPVVPGTTLKGAVRSVFEALTESGSPRDENHHPKKGSRLSSAGALFGALGYRGRVTFGDAEADGPLTTRVVGVSTPYSPRKEGGRRFYGAMKAGGRVKSSVPVETIPEGTMLFSRLDFVNVTRAELGGVLTSLGMVGSFHLRLGGGKYDALGWVMAYPGAFSVLGREQLLGARLERIEDEERIQKFADDALAAFKPAAPSALAELREKMQPGKHDRLPENWR